MDMFLFWSGLALTVIGWVILIFTPSKDDRDTKGGVAFFLGAIAFGVLSIAAHLIF